MSKTNDFYLIIKNENVGLLTLMVDTVRSNSSNFEMRHMHTEAKIAWLKRQMNKYWLLTANNKPRPFP